MSGWSCQRPYSIRTRIKTVSQSSVQQNIPGQRPYAIRTRIKTNWCQWLPRRTAGQRPYSIRTRIKTITSLSICIEIRLVRDHIPLEQGLRHALEGTEDYQEVRQRPYSIRTRIKTHGGGGVLRRRVSQRPYSIRTRIKTDRSKRMSWSR